MVKGTPKTKKKIVRSGKISFKKIDKDREYIPPSGFRKSLRLAKKNVTNKKTGKKRSSFNAIDVSSSEDEKNTIPSNKK